MQDSWNDGNRDKGNGNNKENCRSLLINDSIKSSSSFCFITANDQVACRCMINYWQTREFHSLGRRKKYESIAALVWAVLWCGFVPEDLVEPVLKLT